MKTLTIIGTGRVGLTLGYLLLQAKLVRIGSVFNRRNTSSEVALHYFQQGEIAGSLDQLSPSNLYLLSVADDQIKNVIADLLTADAIVNDSVIFHCSGALSSTLLQPLVQQKNIHIASLHPILSFAQPEVAIKQFSGCYCTVEGDPVACEILSTLFTAIGANCIAINSENKLLYHTALVMASNYVVALLDQSLQLLQSLGMEMHAATAMLSPLTTHAVEQVFQLGTATALTGPIVRGEAQVVHAQLTQLILDKPEIAEVYRCLGKATTALVKRENLLEAVPIEKIMCALQ